MSALSLICDYNSDPDSDSDGSVHSIQNLNAAANNQTSNRLPVPNLIKENSNTEKHIDDPEKHKGRIRSFPHERGNWSTYVYIPYTSTKKLFCFINLLLKHCSKIAEFDIIDDFHISLSKTIVLKYHWISSFTDSLKEIFYHLHCFDVTLNSLNVYCNEDRTRTFVGLKIDDSDSENLKRVVEKVDKVLTEFKLETFYKNPSFHVSLIWCVGDKEEELMEIIYLLKFVLQDFIFDGSELLKSFCYLNVNQICCKSGNKLYSYKLSN